MTSLKFDSHRQIYKTTTNKVDQPSLNLWQPWLVDADISNLSPAATCLLGISFGLQRHAAQVRASEFAQKVMNWIETSASRTPATSHRSTAASAANPCVELTVGKPAAVTKITLAVHPDQPIPSDLAGQHTKSESPSSVDPQDLSTSTDLPASDTLGISEVPSTDLTISALHQPLQSSLADDSMNTLTEFGGVFYLVNIMLNLGWYADFTQPLQHGLEQNLYELLAWIGEHTCGERFRADPIWTLLAQLAGREMPVTPDHRPPQSWLAERIQAMHHRLAQALGENKADDWIAFVCAHPARIAATATRLDVFFSLKNLPITIRLSGLDRDPGWVPAAGRFIAFHFD